MSSSADSRTEPTEPVPPDPAAFGIGADYYDTAAEGARQWTRRNHFVPESIRWIARGVTVIGGIAVGVMATDRHCHLPFLVGATYLSLLGMAIVIEIVEALHDFRLLRDYYGPRFNPNPESYRKYAIEVAKYETNVATVYVSKNWICHSSKYCSGMMRYWEMPRWKAQRIRSCYKCGYFIARPKELPRPFGKGFLPNSESQRTQV